MKEKKDSKDKKKKGGSKIRKAKTTKTIKTKTKVSRKKSLGLEKEKKAPKKQEQTPKKEGGIFILESKKILRLILALLFLMLIFILFNFFSLLKTRRELKDYLEEVRRADEVLLSGDYDSFFSNEDEELEEEKQEKIVPGWRSFGDNFSSTAYLDQEKTNLFLDDVVTALTFPPLIEKERISDFNTTPSASSGWVLTGEKDSCRFTPVNNCLRVTDDKELIYNNRKIDLPREMWAEEIRRIDVSFLSTKYVLSFSVADEEQERVYAYFFDGRRYQVLIGKNSEEKIITEYGQPGGIMVAGGDDDDFIIFYSGYEGRAFHYQGAKLNDISRFFGLRVTAGGFYPYIIKQGEGKDSLWYILSLTEDKKRLIKLWQNNSEEIKGAIDLSYQFREFSGLKIAAFRSLENNRAELEFVFVKDENSNTPLYLKEEGLWRFKDKGFDNSIDRQVVSLNLNYSQGEISSAYFNEIFFESDFSSATIYLSSDPNKFLEARPGEKITFPDNSSELYWRGIFKAGDYLEYSPWFDHVNDLKYFLTGKN